MTIPAIAPDYKRDRVMRRAELEYHVAYEPELETIRPIHEVMNILMTEQGFNIYEVCATLRIDDNRARAWRNLFVPASK